MISKTLAECLGAFAIVFFGCGSILVAIRFNQPEILPFVPLVFGLTVCFMIYALGHISGAHFNPAVTLAFASVKRFPWKEVPGYWIAQFLGGILACVALLIILPDLSSFASTQPQVSLSRAFFVEFLLTFFLMFVIKSVATDSRAVGMMAGAAIGITVAVDAFLGGALSGASMNPARSLGPALFEGHVDTFWLYLIAPLLGALAGAHLYQFIRCESESDSRDVKGCC
jgi:aquaporin NIP